MPQQSYEASIDACIECATVSNHCVVACLEEEKVRDLTKCIRLNLECATVAQVAAELMNLNSGYVKEICELCAVVATACAEENEKHASLVQCEESATACNACAEEARNVAHQFVAETEKSNKQPIRQQECAAIARAAAQLMNFESTYSKEICRLSATICEAYAGTFDKIVNSEVAYAMQCSTISSDAHRHLVKKDKDAKVQPEKQQEISRKKKKHSSALLAASMYRSPVGAVRGTSYATSGGDYSGIWTEFKEEGGAG